MDIALAAGSLLLFAVWHQLRISYYRKPLLYTALALVMVAGPDRLCALAAERPRRPALGLCGLALVAIIGEIPRAALVHISLVAFFGVWLKGLDQALGFWEPNASLFCCLAMATFNLVLLTVAEIVRTRDVRPRGEIELGTPDGGPSRPGCSMPRSRDS